MANVCCSIEMEPRTLSEGQLNHAKEVAVDVVRKMEAKEASNITLVEQMVTLPPVAAVNDIDRGEEDDGQVGLKLVEFKENTAMIERPCQCSCISSSTDSPDLDSFKEPLSAPF